jgi:DNA adenine methylase
MGAMPDMKIGALAPWFGGKRTLAPVIVAELGKHRAYWEPFCGSMAVLLAKPRAGMEVVNDLHGDLINLARVVASDRAVDLFERSQRMLMHTELFTECKNACFSGTPVVAPSIDKVDDDHVGRALQFFVMSWQGRNGAGGTVASNVTVARRFTHNGGSGGIRWQSAVDSIPAWHQRLRGVQIVNMEAIEMLDRIGDQDGSAIYADPPYLVKGAKYVHDYDWLAHRKLAKALARFQKARVIVSYYDHPDLAQLYPEWTKREVHITKALVNQGKRDATGEVVKAPEVLLINGPSYAEVA